MTHLRLLVSLLILMTLHPHDAPGQRSAAGDGDAGLVGGCWTLVRLVDGGERLLDGAHVTVCFASDGKVSGSTGLNDYQGSYAADPDEGLRWLTRFQVTQRGGPPALLRLELVYLPALFHASRWQILPAGPELRLTDPDGRIVLSFRRPLASP